MSCILQLAFSCVVHSLMYVEENDNRIALFVMARVSGTLIAMATEELYVAWYKVYSALQVCIKDN